MLPLNTPPKTGANEMSKQVVVEKPFFYTEDGRKVYFNSISLMDISEAEKGIEQEYRERGEPIDPPTYTVEAVGGAKITKELTKNNLLVDGDEVETERRMKAWAEHEVATNAMKEEIGTVTTEIILEAIEIDVTDEELQAWAEKKRKRRIKIPTEKDELIKRYKMGELLRTPKDLLKAQGEIMVLSSSGAVTREAVEAAEDTFLRSLQEKANRQTGILANDVGYSEKPTEKPLDTQ